MKMKMKMKMIFRLGVSLLSCFSIVLWMRMNLKTDSLSYRRPRPNLGASASSRIAFDPSRVTQISSHPRVFVYKNFLSDEECDHLISLAKDKLTRSMVFEGQNGTVASSKVRTSSGYFINYEDEVVSSIGERIAAWSLHPVENTESFHILRYQRGEKYEPHHDYFDGLVSNQVDGGQRDATLLMYLSNVKKGGETVFPYSKAKRDQSKDDTWSNCAKSGYAVKPKKGDALLFFNLHLNATPDADSKHGSCPVIEGEKWSATRWIHVHSFVTEPEKLARHEGCIDENVNCPQWAAADECEKNRKYMVGSNEVNGYCRMSCNACD